MLKLLMGLSGVCNKIGIKLVHISTDHLFDGTNAFNDEQTPLSPLNTYGKTKGEGEKPSRK